jgi:hypothetical protein
VAPVEDIYVVRSVRTSRGMPTDFCAESRTGFAPTTYEDRYTFHAITTGHQTEESLILLGVRWGTCVPCFGETSNRLRANFYAEGDLASLSFVAGGDRESPKADFESREWPTFSNPTPSSMLFRHFLNLSDLPDVLRFASAVI